MKIKNDLISEKRMNRLLIGDVGSGKTIVAFLAAYINYLAGYQSAFMAPTEILAAQHYETLTQYLEPFGVRIGLLVGGMRAKAKRELLENYNPYNYSQVLEFNAAAYLAAILISNNINVLYHVSDLNRYYYLRTTDDQMMSSIFAKYLANVLMTFLLVSEL